MAVRMMGPGFDSKAWERGDRQADKFTVTFEGAVLDTLERNMHDDSDFYALVWDEDGQKVRKVQYATTRGWTYPNGASVDATDEAWAKAAHWYRAQALDRLRWKDRTNAREVKVGRKVRVTKGRTRGKRPVATGTEGWVAALQPGYGWNSPADVALQVGDQLVFISADRVEVIDPEQFETDDDELQRRADWAEAQVRDEHSTGLLRGAFDPAFYA